MSSPHDEAALLRRRLDALEADVAALARRADCGPTAIVVKVQGAPTDPAEFVSVKAVTPDGDEAEGEPVTLNEEGEAFVVANVGTTRPPPAAYLIADLVDGLWTVQYDGAE